MAENKRTRTVYRLPPCHSCDVERTERWLGDMAQKGLFLKQDGIYWGVVRFQTGEPKDVQYRLFSGWQEPTLRTFWKNRDTPPTQEEQDIHARYGWRYVAQRDMFYIYAQEGDGGRELHTDPEVQAIDIRVVSQWIKWTELFFVLFSLLILGILCLTMAETGELFFFLAEAFGFILFSVVLLTFSFTRTVYKVLTLRRLRRKLQAGEPLDRQKPWRRYAVVYRLLSSLFVVLVILYGILSVVGREEMLGNDPLQFGLYPGEPPVPTVAELVPEGVFTPNLQARTMYSEGKSIFYPVKLHIWEEGELISPDGARQTVFLHTLYYETRTPEIAEMIARELLLSDQSYEHLSYEELPPMDLDVDDSVLYCVGGWGTDLLIQNDAKVLQTCLYQEGGTAISQKAWANQMAQAVQ